MTDAANPNDDIARLAAQIRRAMWNPEARRRLNEQGVHLTRANFYSSIPSIEEIEKSFEYAGDDQPWGDSPVFDDDALTAFLRELMPWTAEFSPPDKGNVDDPSAFFWDNPAFSFADAMAYWCVLRKARPEVVVEIGSGFSTLVARAALDANGTGRLVCVEPFPKPFVERLDTELVQQPVQELPLAWFDQHLGDGSVLFIDSTHTVKTGSDCLHLYLRVLPRMAQHLFVHVHDIFLPSGYPQDWLLEHDLHWTEQYLLLALLEGHPDFHVLFGSHYHRLRHPELLAQFMGGKAEARGGSFWLEKNGSR